MKIRFIMTIDLVDLVQSIPYICGITIALVLLSRWRISITYVYLSLFVFCYSSPAIVPLLYRGGVLVDYPFLLYCPLEFGIFTMSFLYTFLCTLSGELDRKRLIQVFVLPILLMLSHLYFWQKPNLTKIQELENGKWLEIIMTYRGIGLLYSMVMIIITLRTVKRYQNKVDQFYSEGLPQGFSWVKATCFYIMCISVPLIVPSTSYPDGVFPYVAITFTVSTMALVIWVGIEGMNQKFMYLTSGSSLEEGTTIEGVSKVSGDKDDSVESSLLEHIAEEISYRQLYRSVDLNLKQLAIELNISARKLSNLINQESGRNFRNFINAFRVDYAKGQLDAGALERMNMNGLAQEAGFKSKTTFYSAFKQEVGRTPLEYLQMGKSKRL